MRPSTPALRMNLILMTFLAAAAITPAARAQSEKSDKKEEAATAAKASDETTAGSSVPQLPGSAWKFDRESVALLPNGGHVASILEFFYLPAVMANTDTGGFARPENVQVSQLGESYKWQRWYFAGADISNPSNPGEPLIYMPLHALSSISAEKYAVANTQKNGYHLQPLTPESQKSEIALSMPLQVGGFAVIPRAVADREPASDWGAPEKARGYEPGSFEGRASYAFKAGNSNAFLYADGYRKSRHFNNLASPENAAEFTLLGAFNPGFVAGDELHASLQYRSRANLGAEYWFAESQTLKSDQVSGVTNYRFATAKAEGTLALGYANRNTTLNSQALQRSAVDSLIQAPALLPTATHTLFFDASGFKKIPGDAYDLEYGINSRIEFEHRRLSPPANQLSETLYNAPLAVTQYESSSVEANYLMRWQPFVRAQKKLSRSEYVASANAHIDWGFTDAGSKVGFVHPGALISGKTMLGNSGYFVSGGLQHDTLGFTLQEVSYLNRDGLSGTRYNWADTNGNGVADAGELSQPSRTGAKYSTGQKGLEAPQKEELNLSVGYAGFKGWLLEFNFNGRIYRKLFEVRYADGTSPQFTPSSAGGTVAVYDRTGTGNEVYELRNAEKDAYYAHTEITLAQSDKRSDWIIRASIGGYFGAGYTPQGMGMFYNDVGVYNETTADPNFRENRFGRLDNDRGYIGKIIFGRRFAKVFSVMNVLRYRDGESLAGYRRVTGLSQGPILVPFEERGGGLTGVGRYTYSLAWDLRLRYETVFSGNPAWAFLDIYNLVNSRTELTEYPLEGTAFRDPVEQGIARTLRLGLGMNF